MLHLVHVDLAFGIVGVALRSTRGLHQSLGATPWHVTQFVYFDDRTEKTAAAVECF